MDGSRIEVCNLVNVSIENARKKRKGETERLEPKSPDGWRVINKQLPLQSPILDWFSSTQPCENY